MRGKLRLYIGAAPGVGKTYKMLADARARQQEGVSVMIGLIETHGRKETEEMIGDLPVVPLLTLFYKGHELKELDVDRILSLHPDI
ncbi:MAG: sensor histidine kinase KdpD, partial [Exiguobacterium sp.]|nr:sensor histidine kinase KdpD [Exiguobacterium sp.]